MKTFLLSVFVFIGIMGACGSEKEQPSVSAQDLRAMVVKYPDSVLTLLNSDACRSMPPFRINLLKGLAYNEKRMFSLVERYAGEALKSDSIDSYPAEKLNALTMLASARCYYGDFPGSIEASTEAIELARQSGNKPAELNILTSMAQTSFAMGDRDQGYDYLDMIINQRKDASSARELANISSAYGMKVIELYADDRYEDALALGYDRLDLIDDIDRIGGTPEGYTDQQRAYTYARIASSAQCLGLAGEAQKAYENFMATDYAGNVAGRCFITDYLLESARWDKVIEFTAPLFPMFEGSDTINGDYRSLLVSNAMAEYGLGNFRQAYLLMSRAATVADSMNVREKDHAARELATLFSLKEKEMALEKVKGVSQRNHILWITSTCIGLLILLILLIIWRQYRVTLRHNRTAARQIDELIAQRDKLMASYRQEEAGDSPTDTDFSEFRKMEQKLWKEKIFTIPELNRDMLAEKCGLSRARALQLIQTFSGLTPNDYINRLRVEYSVKMIREHPEWTIDAIAESAGYKRRATYYSHFNKIFGLTPAQYRKEKGIGTKPE